MSGYEQWCADIDFARGSRECVETDCVACNQKADQRVVGWSTARRWETVRCPECDSPLCSRCEARIDDGEQNCPECVSTNPRTMEPDHAEAP